MSGHEDTIGDALPRLPLRVLVIGSSTVIWTSMMSGPREDLALPRAIEAQLAARGHVAEVRCSAVLGQPTKAFFKTWERDVATWSPDVVVCVAGHYEVVHLLLPRWFERYANRVNKVPGRMRERYRRYLVRGVWKTSAKLQMRIDRPGRHLARRRLQRAAEHLRGYIALTRQVQSPGFAVLELIPPAPRQEAWFPGMTARVELVDQLLRDVVDSFDTPDVTFVEVAPTVRRLYGDDLAAATPDGFHYTPELHRAVASSVADWIEKWAAGHPHLGGRP